MYLFRWISTRITHHLRMPVLCIRYNWSIKIQKIWLNGHQSNSGCCIYIFRCFDF